MAVIALEQVAKNFGSIKIIDRLDLRIEDGEFVIFVGPSGSGKSTLLRLIAGLEDCSSGRVFIDGIDVTDMGPAERALSMVFQSYALYPTKTVRGNMSFGLEVARLPKPEIDRRVNAAAAALRLEALMERKPKALSGGQRQRVAIGRAIVREPVAFLFDEPLSNLDAALRVEMRIEIAKLHQRLNATMIYVTHDQVEAMTLADKIVVLDKGEIQQVGSPMQLYDQPANLFVAQFIGSPKMNVLEAKTEAGGFRLPVADGFVPSDNPPPAVAKIGIRPEDIALASPGDHHVLGVVDVVERLGSDTYAYVSVGNAGVLTVRIVGNAAWIAVGATVGLVFATNRLHLFDDSGKAIQA